MNSTRFSLRRAARVPALLGLLACAASAQPVTAPWGNVTGIQIDGERMAFETALRAVNPDWSGVVQSSKYNWEGHPSFTLEGRTYTCSHFLEGTALNYTTRVTDAGRGSADVDLSVELKADLPMAGAYYSVDLPASDYSGATFELIGADSQPLPVLKDHSGSLKELVRVRARGFRASGLGRTLEVVADADTEIVVRQDFVDQPDYLNDPHPRITFVASDPQQRVADTQVYFTVLPGSAKAGASAHARYSIRAGGTIDREPISLVLRPGEPGRRFAGIGGNFRMQFPELDAQVVDYCLANLDVTWGRIAFPWAEWQPQEASTLEAKAAAGGLSPYFYAQIEMARELSRRKIPIILSVWVPPEWAVDRSIKIPKGVKLDARKLGEIAESIAAYVSFLKRTYGIEPALFSFNETDYGVEVQQSPEEHAAAIRAIGSAFAARGLATKMLLGDTGAGTLAAHRMVGATEADRSLYPYLGAISFHNYHGLTPADLKAWADSARATNLPLLADEGGADSAAHRYPLIWTTPWFAQLEVDQYVRIGAACQPLSVLPWQLNADYSLLSGGGTYGDNGPLRPTQRFWSLKQLGALSGAFWIPVSADRPNISCAALGDIARGAYAIHITNNGASRQAVVSGLPPSAKKWRIYVTDAQRGMELVTVRGAVDGKFSFLLEAQTFTSLVSE